MTTTAITGATFDIDSSWHRRRTAGLIPAAVGRPEPGRVIALDGHRSRRAGSLVLVR
jgi:hypothetical protein